MPSMKPGSATPATDRLRTTWSMGEFALTADRMPMGMPITMMQTMASVVSSTVAISRCPMSWRTGWLVRKLLPKWPWPISPRKRRYCRQSGRSRPSSCLTAATWSGVGRWPSITSTGEPGRMWVSTKVTVSTPMSVPTIRIRRWTTYGVIAEPCAIQSGDPDRSAAGTVEVAEEHGLIGRVGGDPLQVRTVRDYSLRIGDEHRGRIVEHLLIGLLPGLRAGRLVDRLELRSLGDQRVDGGNDVVT